MDKENVTHTHTHTPKYYSALKKKEMLSFATTWEYLEGIILSEINQRKTNSAWYYWYVESKGKESQTHRNRVEVVASVWGVDEIGTGE